MSRNGGGRSRISRTSLASAAAVLLVLTTFSPVHAATGRCDARTAAPLPDRTLRAEATATWRGERTVLDQVAAAYQEGTVLDRGAAAHQSGVGRDVDVLWFDDMESGENGWTHRDHGWGIDPHFHVDAYMAFEGSGSWWCGSFDFDDDGGYGNGWDDRLELPPIDISGATYPVLTFAHYFHSEPARDRTVIQAMQAGAFIDLNAGFDGLAPGGDWIDLGSYGYVLENLDNPLTARFRFTSDGMNSDEDGGFDSVGGGYMVDNIKVFDFYGGATYFLDDAESGGLCNPNVQELAGDYWHIIERACAATSGTRVWWCGDDSDTTIVPARLDNWLISPPVGVASLSPGTPCTLRYMLHAEVPTDDNDYWTVYASMDDGATWYQLGAWWGDFGACSGWSQVGATGLSVSHLLPGSSFRALFRFLTTDDGCGPGEAGGAGITIDDVALIAGSTPVAERSWGRIKATFLPGGRATP